jgi:hypothetical protein
MAKPRPKPKPKPTRSSTKGGLQPDNVDVFPHQLRMGDRYTDEKGHA